MLPNPPLGVFFHWLGGLASGSFYVPYRGVKGWAWETYWLVGGFFSWIIMPWTMALLITHDLTWRLARSAVQQPVLGIFVWRALGTWRTHLRPDHALFGNVAWHGRGARIYGGFRHVDAATFFAESFQPMVLGTTSGLIVLLGSPFVLSGIALAGAAGVSKEKEMSEDAETRLDKGIQS